MITCRESARLLSEKRDHPLTWRKRIALRVHLALCGLCRVYASQLSVVCGVSREAGEKAPEVSPRALPDDRRRRIKDAISGDAG
jgi:hypothetical protein